MPPIMRSDIKIDGADELLRLLKGLPGKVERNVVNRSLRAGGKIVLTQARYKAPKLTGTLRKSLALRAIKRKGRGRRKGSIGVQVTTQGKAPHAHLVDQGTQDRWTKPDYKVVHDETRYRKKFKKIIGGLAFRGHVTPTYFLRDALAKNADNIIAIFSGKLRELATKQRAKLGI